MEQILSSLFFDVVLLRCQKLIPRDQVMRSRFSFAALDTYFVHKTVSMLFFQYILQRHKSSQTSASFHWHPGVPVPKQGNGCSLVPGTLKTQRRPQIHLCQLQNRVTIGRNLEYVSEDSPIKQGVGSFTSL